MVRKFLLTSALLATLVGGVTTPALAGDGALLGMLGGGALGGFIGNQFGHGAGRIAATGFGAFTGAVIGNSVGRSFDRPYYYGGGYSGYGYAPYYASNYYYEPMYVAPPAPRVVYVQPQVVEYRQNEPATVESGYVGEDSNRDSSRYCREFTQHIRIDGKVVESYGTACLRPDGTWQIQR